jgi:hypothetical protein
VTVDHDGGDEHVAPPLCNCGRVKATLPDLQRWRRDIAAGNTSTLWAAELCWMKNRPGEPCMMRRRATPPPADECPF